MLDIQAIRELANTVEEPVIQWRRYLHERPELSFQEKETGEFVAELLSSFGGIEVSRPAGNSVLGRIYGANPGPTLAIRADMDALPIQEESGVEFASKNPGVMHACGHDGHTAMLLGTAKILAKMTDRFDGEIRLLFQHAEEMPPGGADEMVAAGVMDGVDMIVGTHLQTPLPVGAIGITYKEMMAAPDMFDIKIHGAGGHAAYPHTTVDSIAIASQVVTNLQHIVSRNTDPIDNLVVSVTQFHAGTAHNVIPGVAYLQGTVRSFKPDVRRRAPELMERVIRGITDAHGAGYEFNYTNGYDAVVNSEEVISLVDDVTRELFGEALIVRDRKRMGGEDFSRYQREAPSAFFDIGVGNAALDTTYPHHHPQFAIDESALINGVQIFLAVANKTLDFRTPA